MLSRTLPLTMMVLGLVLCGLYQPLSAREETHEGMVVTAGDGKLTMTFTGDAKKHTHDVAADAKITLDGETAKLEDLKPGFHAQVTIDEKEVVTKIDAHSKLE